MKEAHRVASDLSAHGFDVLLDDRDARTGEKLADADLIGIPMRVVISDKTIAAEKLEVKARTAGEAEMLSFDELIATLK
jgi:prolyl-tRNA synthetase